MTHNESVAYFTILSGLMIFYFLVYINISFKIRDFITRRKDGSRLCKLCKGSGLKEEIYGPYPCPNCEGTGKFDWVQNIIKGSE